MSFDQNKYGNVKRLIGNVILKNENTFMMCDSAYLYDEDQSFEAFSNVRINQADSVTVTAKHLLYTSKDKVAHLDGNVSLVQGKMTLNTEKLDYSLKDKRAYYNTPGRLTNKESVLTSMSGEYWTQTKEAHFRQQVKLKNPDYELLTDTLIYNTGNEESKFFGPTNVVTKTDSIHALKGWYDTKNEVGKFANQVVIKTGSQILFTDSLYFNQKLGKGYAHGNVDLFDSYEKMHILGDEGYYTKKPQKVLINNKAFVSKIMGLDTVYIWADTLFYQGDSIKHDRRLNAWGKVRLFKNDVQAVCDTLCYMIDDSNVSMFKNPILWSSYNQLSADSIYLLLSKNHIRHIILQNHGFIASHERGTHYNQIKGDSLVGFFNLGELERVKVFGKGQSIYYAREDSCKYIGVNEIDCPNMEVFFSLEKVKGIKFLGSSKATLHPIEKIRSTKFWLKGFNWKEDLRPSKPNLNF